MIELKLLDGKSVKVVLVIEKYAAEPKSTSARLVSDKGKPVLSLSVNEKAEMKGDEFVADMTGKDNRTHRVLDQLITAGFFALTGRHAKVSKLEHRCPILRITDQCREAAHGVKFDLETPAPPI